LQEKKIKLQSKIPAQPHTVEFRHEEADPTGTDQAGRPRFVTGGMKYELKTTIIAMPRKKCLIMGQYYLI
jgi:hypothetical protein